MANLKNTTINGDLTLTDFDITELDSLEKINVLHDGVLYDYNVDGKFLYKIQASDPEEDNKFGYSVACSDTRIVVGSPYAETTRREAGCAYIYDTDGNFIAKIQESDPDREEYFGHSVSCSDTRIVVGGPENGSGSAYIYDIDGNLIAKIKASDPESNDDFGHSVSCSDTRIVVGAYKEDTTASNAGSAYIYDINGNFIAKIQASDPESMDYFGWSVSCSNTRIVVGAYQEDTNGTDAGSAYIYDINGNFIAKIQASDPEADDEFGHSVSCSNTRIVVGAPEEDTTAAGAGSVYIYDINGNFIAKIQASDPESNDEFGHSVACSDTRIVVGAYKEDTTATRAGSTYIYDTDGNFIEKILAYDSEEDDEFGYSVACSDTRIVVGAPEEDTTTTDAGSAYIYGFFDGNIIDLL